MRDQADNGTVDRSKTRPGKWLTVLLIVIWLAALYGFVSTPVLIALSIAGPLLLRGGYAMTRDALPHVGAGFAYLCVMLFGLLLIGGAAATLSAGFPGAWLAESSIGRGLLEYRQARVKQAIEDGDVQLVGWLADRGLATAAPIENFGRPLLHQAGDADMVRTLIAAGFSPDAGDSEGRTLLMLTYDERIAEALLEGGADTEARDLEGRTALAYAHHKDIGHLELLLEAGADVHATDHAGVHVSHEFLAAGPGRELLEQSAGNRTLPEARTLLAADRGRTDWLLASRIAPESVVNMRPEKPAPGERATLDIRLVNNTDRDRLIKVRALLGNAALLIRASHGGEAVNPRVAGISRDVRWPLLTLPESSEGGLTLDIVGRADPDVGDLSVDVRYREVGATEDEVIGVYVSRTGEYTDDPSILALILIPIVVGIVVWVTGRYIGKWLRWKTGSTPRAAALFGALVCGGLTVFLVFSMAEPWIGMEETTCDIHDRRVKLETMRTSSGTGSRSRTSYSTYLEPVVAVSYEVRGEQVTSTGFAIGATTRSVHDLDSLVIGESARCWFDPDIPTRFTLTRTPGVAGIVGLLTVLACFLVFIAIVIALRPSRVDN